MRALKSLVGQADLCDSRLCPRLELAAQAREELRERRGCLRRLPRISRSLPARGSRTIWGFFLKKKNFQLGNN